MNYKSTIALLASGACVGVAVSSGAYLVPLAGAALFGWLSWALRSAPPKQPAAEPPQFKTPIMSPSLGPKFKSHPGQTFYQRGDTDEPRRTDDFATTNSAFYATGSVMSDNNPACNTSDTGGSSTQDSSSCSSGE